MYRLLILVKKNKIIINIMLKIKIIKIKAVSKLLKLFKDFVLNYFLGNF